MKELIADARDEWREHGGSLAHTAGVARALAVRADQRRTGVKDNPRAAPTVKGAEYGALAWPQFPVFDQPVWRDGRPVSGGYGVHEALRENPGKYLAIYVDAMTDLLRRAHRAAPTQISKPTPGRRR